MIPRDRYPMTRAGYHQWKNELKKFHAGKSAEVLGSAGYPKEIIRRVAELNLKKNFPAEPEARTLEDALCLMFLEFQLGEFAAKTEEDKVINALRKSWEKMTARARDEALEIDYDPRARALVERALQTAD